MTELGSVPGRPATTARRGTAGRAPAPPPRPALASDLAPPLHRKQQAGRPGAALVATLPWFAGLAAALVGVAATAADSDALRARLTAEALASDPSASEQLVSSGVRTTVLLVLGVQVALALLAALWAVLLLRRAAWARWVLLGTGLLVLAAAALAQRVVAGGVDVDRIALLAEGGLAVVGSLALLAPPLGRWLRPHRD
jgi:hypothetical protein